MSNSHNAASSFAARFLFYHNDDVLCAPRFDAFGIERHDGKTDETD